MKRNGLALLSQASKIVSYDLKRQALTNKDQRAVLPRSFLAIALAPATTIVVFR